ncbi:hypothetical protein C8R44DRAFT_755550 [Mycena epipterygia]|nr:hypothetical protein C8R44DRAFT_755550 [Mycena epipterygia]
MAIGFLDNSNALFPDPGDTYGNSGQFYSQLAEFDLATNQTKYRETLQQYFQLANETLAEQFGAPNFTGALINDGLNFGHAAAIAYMTYNDSQFLTYAKQSWSAGRLYTISQDDLASGKIPGKDFPLTTTCDGLTMAGGTFHAKNVTDSGIVGLSTGGFLILSALLAEATPEDKLYLEAAEESASFIRDHLYNANNVVQDEISASCQGNVGNVTVLESHNSGLMIEGLAILYSLTHNDSIHDLVGEIVTTAMENTEWQGPDGILASGGNSHHLVSDGWVLSAM